MKKAVLYARISEGKDILEQINSIKEYAIKNDFEIVSEFIDFDKKKLNKLKMIEYLKNSEVRIILVFCIDRLTRNLQEYIKYEEMGIKILAVNDVELVLPDDFVAKI